MDVIATYPVCNTLGIEILDIEHGINDKVVYRFSNDPKIHYSRIYYKVKGECFRTKIGMINLNDCIRV